MSTTIKGITREITSPTPGQTHLEVEDNTGSAKMLAGNAAVADIGTAAGTVAAGNDSRFPTLNQKAGLDGAPTLGAGDPAATQGYVDAADSAHSGGVNGATAHIPAGGTAGQILTKDTAVDRDVSWQAPTGWPVDSVHGRVGAVTSQSGDYTAAQVGADPAGSAGAVQSNLNVHAGGLNGAGAHVPAGGLTGQVLAKATGVDGDTVWTAPGAAPVDSVFGRTGAVTAQAGDYTAAQVGADPAGSASAVQGNLNTHAGGRDGAGAHVPIGGTTGQVLTKATGADGDTQWSAPGAAPVDSVFGRTGVVIAQPGDYSGAQVSNSPAGNISAITVQDAINELDTEKTPASHAADAGIHVPAGGLQNQVLAKATAADGDTAWVAAGAAPVDSVFGRTGVVTAQADDYTAAQVGADPAGSAATVQGNLDAHVGNAAIHRAFTVDEAAAITGANAPTALNPFQTQADLGAYGDVFGPAGGVVDDEVAVYSGITGKTIKSSSGLTFGVINGHIGNSGIHVPAGGTANQVLTKASATPGDTTWTTPTTSPVDSVFGRTGAVTAQSGDYTAAEVTNAPSGGVAALTVQGAIDELDTEKAPITHVDDVSHVPTGGTTNQVLAKASGAPRDLKWADAGAGGSGDVVGPAASIDDEIASYSGTTGKLIKQSGGLTVANVNAHIGDVSIHRALTVNQHNAITDAAAPSAGNVFITAAEVTDYVDGPAASVNDEIASYSGTTGKLLKQSSGLTASSVSTHIASTANPHSVTAAQVGADPAGTAAALLTTPQTVTGDWEFTKPVKFSDGAGLEATIGIDQGNSALVIDVVNGITQMFVTRAGGTIAVRFDGPVTMEDPGIPNDT